MKDSRYFTGGNGTYYIGTSALTGKKFLYLVINTDAVISVLKDEEGVIDYVTLLGLGSKTISAGMIIRLPNNKRIAEITLASGSAIGIDDVTD